MNVELLTRQDISDVKDALVEAVTTIKDDQEYITPDYLLDKWGINKSTQAKWRTERRIPYYKVGKNILYKKDEILEHFEQCKVQKIA